MPKKGHTNNPKGRPKGTPNKITADLRQRISDFLDGNFDEVTKEWRQLEGKDKLAFYRDLLKYAIPQLSNMSADISIDRLTDEQVDELYGKIINKLEDHENS